MAKKKSESGLKTVRVIAPKYTAEDAMVYSNSVMVNHTPWDFTLFFNHVSMPVGPISTDDKSNQIEVTADKIIAVNIPVNLMPGLIRALRLQLERYEESYGKVEQTNDNATRTSKRMGG